MRRQFVGTSGRPAQAAHRPKSADAATFERVTTRLARLAAALRGASPALPCQATTSPETPSESAAQRLAQTATRRSRCCAKSETRPVKPRQSSINRPASTPCSATRPSPSPTKSAGQGGLGEREGRPHGPRHRRAGRGLLPQPGGRRWATPLLRPRTSPSGRKEGKAPAITYAHVAREAGHSRVRPPVLVLFVLQPVQRPPRERVGGDADQFRSGTRRPRPWTKDRAKSSSSSTPAASAASWATRRCRRKAPTPSYTRRRARTRPTTTPPSTSRTGSTAPASAATPPPSRCAN